MTLALTATLGYDECICTFDCGFETFGRNWMEIAGENGVWTPAICPCVFVGRLCGGLLAISESILSREFSFECR